MKLRWNEREEEIEVTKDEGEGYVASNTNTI